MSRKTTCLYSLLQEFGEVDIHQKKPAERTVQIEEIGQLWIDREGNLPIYTHVFDSPGYGDDVDNKEAFDLIRNDLIARHQRYADMVKSSLKYSDNERKSRDERIHCCLYFISPHRMKKIDELFIEYLSDVVLIVPVVAKADTMTMLERHSCLTNIVAKLTLIDRRVREDFNFKPIFNFDTRSSGDITFLSKKSFKKMDEKSLLAMADDDLRRLESNNGGAEGEESPLKKTIDKSHLDNLTYNEDSDCSDSEDEGVVVDASERVTSGGNVESSDGDTDTTTATTVEDSGQIHLSSTALFAVMQVLDGAYYDLAGGQQADSASSTTSPTQGQSAATMIPPVLAECVSSLTRFRNIFAIAADPSRRRIYPWGICDVDDPMHSDFPLLKQQLFQHTTIRNMVEGTTARTSKLMEHLEQDRKRRVVVCVVPAVLIVIAIVVGVFVQGAKQSDLERLSRPMERPELVLMGSAIIIGMVILINSFVDSSGTSARRFRKLKLAATTKK